MNRLFEFLGNQIVYICRKTVKMTELFSGDTESVLNKLRVSMNCCENYISVYTKVKQKKKIDKLFLIVILLGFCGASTVREIGRST